MWLQVDERACEYVYWSENYEDGFSHDEEQLLFWCVYKRRLINNKLNEAIEKIHRASSAKGLH